MSDQMEQAVERDAKDLTTCPSCGGEMAFEPGENKLKCLFCGKRVDFDIKRGRVEEYDFRHAKHYENTDWGIQDVTIKCESCGGETIVGANDKTQFCAFCGSQHLIEIEDEQLGMVPESLVAFKFPMKEAEQKFKTWIGKRYLSPSNLKNSYRKGKMVGMFMPYWTYDSDTETDYRVEIGTKHTRKDADGKEEEYYTWRTKTGSHKRFFDDVLICGSKDEGKLVKKIEPYYTSELVGYTPEFLAGYYAKKYNVGPETGFEDAKKIMKSTIDSEIRTHIHGDKTRGYRSHVLHYDVKFKHILLPLYISTYKYNGKVFNFMINGQTGEVQGEAPISPIKATLLGVGVAALIFIIYYFFFR